MAALPPLARVMRYGNVRGTDASMVRGIVDATVARICVGLAPACSSLDADAAAEMARLIDGVTASVGLLDDAEQRAAWQASLRGVATDEGLAGTVRGRACRILLDERAITAGDIEAEMGRSLSPAAEPVDAAGFVEGFLRDSGLVLLHDAALFGVLDAWLAGLDGEAFTSVLPLLRRTVGAFPAPERRALGERAKGVRRTSTAIDGLRRGGGRRGAAGPVADPRHRPRGRPEGACGVSADLEQERLRRWRLVLGGGEADGTGIALSADDAGRDAALGALYSERERPQGDGTKRSAGLGGSAPAISRWLGDIRRYFPTSVVSIMQRDALERLNLRQLLMEPELLNSFQPDVHLVTQLVSLSGAMPTETRDTARQVIRKVVDELERRLAERTRSVDRRRDRPRRRHPTAEGPRHRLGPDHPQEPAPLPAGAPDGHPRDADRARAEELVAAGRHRGDRPVGVHGVVGRLQLGVFAAVMARSGRSRRGSWPSTPASSTSRTS